MPKRRQTRRVVRIVTVLCVLVFGSVAAWAWTSSGGNPGNAVAGATLGSAGSLAAVKTGGGANRCTSIDVTWTAASNADSYRVESSEDFGSTWTELTASTSLLTYTDTVTHTNETVTFRVTALLAGTSWEGPPATTQLDCGVGTVSDLALVPGSCGLQLDWTPPPSGADAYRIQVAVNGGGYSYAVNGNTFAGPPPFNIADDLAVGDNIEYRVRVQLGGAWGDWSDPVSLTNWGPDFYVESVVLADGGGGVGQLDVGDTVTVTFSQPVDTSSITHNTIRVRASGGARGMYIPATSANVSTTQIGRVLVPASLFSGNSNYAGSATWSAGNTVWTWVSNVSGPTMSAPLSGTWSLGTETPHASCAATGTPLGPSAPTLSGQW